VVQLLEAALDVEPGAEDKDRGESAEGDARNRADPAPVHREHEQEDDAEQRDRAACPGERLRSEER